MDYLIEDNRITNYVLNCSPLCGPYADPCPTYNACAIRGRPCPPQIVAPVLESFE